MEKLNFEHSSKRKKSIIVASLGGCTVGGLTYMSRKENQPIQLGLIWVRGVYQEEGIGKQLITEFVKTIGPGRLVHTKITHDESLHTLEALELKSENNRGSRLILTQPSLLATLPLVRILESGNLEVVSLSIKYDPRNTSENHLLSIQETRLEAITKPLNPEFSVWEISKSSYFKQPF